MQRLELTFTYGDQTHTEKISPDPSNSHSFGREQFARWFSLSESALRPTVSRQHFCVEYSQEGEHFAVIERSKHGSEFRQQSTGEEQPPFVPRRGERLLLGPRSELRISAPSAAAEYIHVLIDWIDVTSASDRSPLLQQLCEHLDQHHCAHLVGLPGSGKQKLVRELADATAPGVRPGGPFTVSTLPIIVDCLPVANNEDDALWRTLARAILNTAASACKNRGYPVAGATIEQIRTEFDAQPPGAPNEALPTFERAFRCVRERAFQNPLLILTHFDALYADLEADMLYCLARLRTEWHELSDHIYLIISTNRPAAMLRVEDEQATRETLRRHFDNLFTGATLAVRHNEPFGALWKTLHAGRAAPLLDANSEATLARLTGNHPGIAEGTRYVIEVRRWLSADGVLSPSVANHSWTAQPLPACINIWQALEPAEQRHLLELGSGRALADEHRQRLHKLGLLTQDGGIFSDIFKRTISGLQSARGGGIPERGLYVDEQRHRVYYDGKECFSGETRESKFFWALYRKPNTVVLFRDLLIATNESGYNVAALSSNPGFRINEQESLSRLAARVVAKVDPQRVYIKNVHGKGYKFLTDAA